MTPRQLMQSAPTLEEIPSWSQLSVCWPPLQSLVMPLKTTGRLLAPEWENRFPVVLHVDNSPAFGHCYVEGDIKFADRGRTVVSPFPLGVGVVHEQSEADAAASLGPLKHLQVAVRVAECCNGAATDVHLDTD